MLRPLTILLALLSATLLLAPLAQAQGSTSLILKLEPLRDGVAPGDIVLLRGTATLLADATAYTSPIGIPVEYDITASPEWAATMVTPASDIFYIPATPGVVVEMVRDFAVLVAVPENVTGTGIGPVTVTGTTGAPNAFIRPATASASTPVRLVEGGPCSDGAVFEAQSAGATVFAPGLGLLGLAPLGLVALGGPRSTGGRLALVTVALAALGAVAAAPTASAQGSSALLVWVDPSSEPLEADGRIVLYGEATYVADATAHTMTSGIPVEFFVRDAPAWATVTVTPSSGVFMPSPMPQATVWTTIPFEVIVDAASDVPPGAIAQLAIGAVTQGNGLVRPAAGHGETFVRTVPLGCTPTEPAPATSPEPAEVESAAENAPPSSEDDVSVQSATATPRPVLPIVVGCALVGAALGLALSRRPRG